MQPWWIYDDHKNNHFFNSEALRIESRIQSVVDLSERPDVSGYHMTLPLHRTENTGRKLNDHNTLVYATRVFEKEVKSTLFFPSLFFRLVMQSPIDFREPVLFGQFGSLNRFKKPINWFLASSSNDVTIHNNSVQTKSDLCEHILLIIALHSLNLMVFVVTNRGFHFICCWLPWDLT